MTLRWEDLPPRMRRALPLTYEDAIRRLMSRLLPINVHLHPEQRLSIDLAEAMRQHTLEGRYKGIWFCVQNEAKRHRITAMIQKAMGLIPGVPDFVFVWSGGGLFCELKAAKNQQTDSQKDFACWCEHCDLEYGVYRSVEEIEAALTAKGALVSPIEN